MRWIPVVIAAIATLAGVIIGSWLNHYFAIRAISPMAQLRETTNAYVDFVDGVAALAQAQRSGADELPHLSRITAAKIRMAIYGHPSVIAAMVDGEKQGTLGTLDSSDASDTFSSIILAIREHVTKDEPRLQPTKSDIKILIFGVHDRDG